MRILALVAIPLVVGLSLPAAAQVPPSVQDMVRHLTPTTRGIRPLGPNNKPPSISLSVHFATNSATLTTAATATLDRLGQALNNAALARYRFRIEGHTDTVGTPSYNLALSRRRAKAVAAYVETHFGIPAHRLVVVGMGEKGLLVPTPPQTPNARNRRVLVVNIGR